jgi:uncharacterized DUF497 family protein
MIRSPPSTQIDNRTTIVYTDLNCKIADDVAKLEFIAPFGFEWDEDKSETNLIKHGIDFDEASEVFYGPLIIRQSVRNNEERWLAIGKSQDRIISVIFTRRKELIRIISARHPRRNEERAYRNTSMGRPAQGQD